MIDYALARRAVLADLRRGRVSLLDVCDAHPDLRRAARHHGEATETPCPVCRNADPLVRVTHVYGDGLREASGRACAARAVAELARTHGELTAYEVEVCLHCSWNHLVTRAVFGERPVVARRRRAVR